MSKISNLHFLDSSTIYCTFSSFLIIFVSPWPVSSLIFAGEPGAYLKWSTLCDYFRDRLLACKYKIRVRVTDSEKHTRLLSKLLTMPVNMTLGLKGLMATNFLVTTRDLALPANIRLG